MDLRMVALLICQTHLLARQPSGAVASDVLAMFAIALERCMPDNMQEASSWAIEFAEYHLGGTPGENALMLLRVLDEKYKDVEEADGESVCWLVGFLRGDSNGE